MKQAAAIVAIALIAAYPFLVYWGLNHLSVKVIGWIFLAVVIIRSITLRQTDKSWLPLIGGIITTTVLLSIFDDPIYLKLNPVIISSCILLTFSYTLIKPPSMIETFARLQNKNLPDKAVPYCRKVTIIWCVFLFLNSMAALYTAIVSDMKTWTLYNGFISYILMALLFAAEFAYRTFILKPDKEA